METAWSKCEFAPLETINLQFCTPPPSLELPDKYNWCRRGLGPGLGVQGQAELGLGDQGFQGSESIILAHSSEGFLTTHHSHCSKPLVSATAPFRNKYINHHPVTAPTKILFRGR